MVNTMKFLLLMLIFLIYIFISGKITIYQLVIVKFLLLLTLIVYYMYDLKYLLGFLLLSFSTYYLFSEVHKDKMEKFVQPVGIGKSINGKWCDVYVNGKCIDSSGNIVNNNCNCDCSNQNQDINQNQNQDINSGINKNDKTSKSNENDDIGGSDDNINELIKRKETRCIKQSEITNKKINFDEECRNIYGNHYGMKNTVYCKADEKRAICSTQYHNGKRLYNTRENCV